MIQLRLEYDFELKKDIMINGILCDIDGVLYESNEVIDGSIDTIQKWRSEGKVIRFLTNTTTKPVEQGEEKLKGFGYEVLPNEVISPLQLAVNLLANESANSICPVVREVSKSVFSNFEIDEMNPDFVIIGDIGDQWDYKLLNRLFQMVRNGSKIIALHKNRFGVKEGSVSLDIGTFVAALEYATGEESIVLGKPSYDFFDRAVQTMNFSKEEVIMIGDDLDADIGGAQDYGIVTALVKSGKYDEKYFQKSSIRPTYVVGSIHELNKILFN